MAMTVRQFESSSRECSKFKPQVGSLPRFWKMDPSSPGVIRTLVVTVGQFEIGCAADSSH